MNLFLILFSNYLLTLINCKHEISYLNTKNRYKKYLSDKLGLNNKHRIIRRSLFNNYLSTNDNSKDYILNLYLQNSNNTTNLTSFNLVQSYNSISKCIANSSSIIENCIESKKKIKKYSNTNSIYLQYILLGEIFKFNLNKNLDLINIVKFDINLNVNLKNLFKNKTKIIYSKFVKFELNLGNKLIDKKLINIKHLNKTNYNLKFTFNNATIFNFKHLKLSLKISIKTKLKKYKFNTNLNILTNLLNKSPLLVIYSNDKSKDQLILSSKRDEPIEVNQETINQLKLDELKSDQNSCEKKEIEINFKELGWDHMIIEPKYIKTYYCDGSCNLPLDDNNSMSSNHAILRALVNKSGKFDLPNVCCVPSKLSSKLFLILDETGSLVMKKIDNLIVDACSCQ